MPITPGTRFGPYEIIAAIGAGGMGEVYSAKDTRLERMVAVKILLSHLSENPDLLARFEREAKIVSGLQHPNICVLHDIGKHEGMDYLVMEFLEGETLAQRLAKGSMKIEETIKIGIEIADALDKAHKQGIVHRDLKPGNVMLTKAGAKLMDFGLAKPTAFTSSSGSGAPAFSAATMSSPASPITQAGSVVGTIQYMSPEQVSGQIVDARSDIFAFGAMLYEMLTGKRAFEGRSQVSVAGAILDKDPEPISSIQPMTPPALEHVVQACLAKEPENRWQSISDVKRELRWVLEGGSQVNMPAVVIHKRQSREHVAWGLAATAILVLLVVGFFFWRHTSQPVSVLRGSLLPPEASKRGIDNPQISPNGKYVIYVADNNGTKQLWAHSFESPIPQPLIGTENASFPFWSADSKSVGFFANGKLKRAEIAGGPVQIIADAPNGRGGAWNVDGIILFSPDRNSPLYRISAAGGTPVPATTLDTNKHHSSNRWPWFLPDGKHFLFMAGTTGTDNNSNQIYFGSLDTKEAKQVISGSSNPVYASGYLLFRRESTLMAQPFDVAKGETTGDAVPFVEDLKFNPVVSLGAFSASTQGILIYQTGSGAQSAQLTWFDNTGKPVSTVGKRELGFTARLSPDNKHTAQYIIDTGGNVDIWIYDNARNIKTRLTFDAAREVFPIWFPDGKRVAYSSDRIDNRYQIYMKNADGSGSEENMLKSADVDVPEDVSSDGKYMVFRRRALTSSNGQDIWILPLTGDRKPYAYLETHFNEQFSRISPDVHWLAYTSDESGKPEVYVSTFPQGGSKWQISSGGGSDPIWSKSGKEIYYHAQDNHLMKVELIISGASVQPSSPRQLFLINTVFPEGCYDVASDGRIMVSSLGDEKSFAPLSFTLNWPATVRK